MRSPLARLTALGAFAVTVAACSGGNGTSLPFAGPPNNAGGNNGSFQSGVTGTALLRFIQGSPDSGTVDVCVDNQPFPLSVQAAVAYGRAVGPSAVTSGIAHTLAVYAGVTGSPGVECSTAPAAFNGVLPIKVTTLSPLASSRLTVVLGGTAASGTLALYAFTEPTFPNAPGGPEAISHNAAPAFSTGKTVGFGTCTTTVTPCVSPVALTGAQSVAAPKPSAATATAPNTPVISALAAVPAGFYDGIGVTAGTPVPITSISVLPLAGQPYVVQLYALDGPAGGLNLLGIVESTLGFGF
ncbi:MAG: hypothetical protein JWN27_3732 [Candidatus Eremiobacteraeota bacterium]|nr:hypothetical protein [Candidatus Eremiobacteraeota bacterium]